MSNPVATEINIPARPEFFGMHGYWAVYRDGGRYDDMRGYGYTWAYGLARSIWGAGFVKSGYIEFVPLVGENRERVKVVEFTPDMRGPVRPNYPW